MTQIAVETQVEAIKKATEKALQSKETALKFLTDAGIIKGKDEKPSKSTKEKK